jgi:hypothetical protein
MVVWWVSRNTTNTRDAGCPAPRHALERVDGLGNAVLEQLQLVLAQIIH